MTKKSDNQFNGAKFVNAQFIGNGNQTRNRYIDTSSKAKDLSNPSDQNDNSVSESNKATLQNYKSLYGQLKIEHSNYLKAINTAERSHYAKLTGRNFRDSIYGKYDRLYTDLERRHKKYLDTISAGGISDVEPGKEGANATNSAADTSSDILAALKEMGVNYDALNKNISQNLVLTSAIAQFMVDTNSKNKEITKEVRALSNAVSGIDKSAMDLKKGQKDPNKKPSKIDEDNLESLKNIANGMVDFAEIASDNLIQGKANQRIFKDIFQIIGVFQKQESVAGSLVELAMIALREVTAFIGESVSEHYKTQEETYATFGLYMERADDFREQNALYNNEMKDKIRQLYELDLQNNVKSTEWWTKQADLLSKGFSSQQSEDVALQTILLNKVVPNLDTNSSIFMDLQQYGMNKIIYSLGGLVESVRENAGTSRITMGSMSTIVDQLGPIELYAKKNLLNKKATAMLSALEDSGMSTEDALKLVTSASGVWSNIYGKLTGGTPAERLAATKILSGEYTDFADTVMGMYGQSANMLSGVPGKGTAVGALLTGAVSDAMGYDFINAWSSPELINENINDKYDEYLKIATDSEESYKSVEDLLKEDFLQTGDQLIENQQNNITIATNINGWLQDLALNVAKITSYMALLLEDKDIDFYTAEANATLEHLAEQQRTGQITAEQYQSEVAKWQKQETAGQEEYMKDAKSKTALASGALALLSGGGGIGIAAGYGLYQWGKSKFNGFEVDYNDIQNTANALNFAGYKSLSGTSDAYQAQHNAKGGYVDKPALSWVAEEQPEIITPIPQLANAVMQGVNLSDRNRDYTEIVSAVHQVGNQIVAAIMNGDKEVTIKFDRNTGLMSSSSTEKYTSLQPRMRRG